MYIISGTTSLSVLQLYQCPYYLKFGALTAVNIIMLFLMVVIF